MKKSRPKQTSDLTPTPYPNPYLYKTPGPGAFLDPVERIKGESVKKGWNGTFTSSRMERHFDDIFDDAWGRPGVGDYDITQNQRPVTYTFNRDDRGSFTDFHNRDVDDGEASAAAAETIQDWSVTATKATGGSLDKAKRKSFVDSAARTTTPAPGFYDNLHVEGQNAPNFRPGARGQISMKPQESKLGDALSLSTPQHWKISPNNYSDEYRQRMRFFRRGSRIATEPTGVFDFIDTHSVQAIGGSHFMLRAPSSALAWDRKKAAGADSTVPRKNIVTHNMVIPMSQSRLVSTKAVRFDGAVPWQSSKKREERASGFVASAHKEHARATARSAKQ